MWRTFDASVRAVAVQRELEPAAERGAVDRGDGRERQRADAPEELVARRAIALARVVERRIFGNSSMSAPTQKTNGLPVSTAARPVAALELVEHLDRRLERASGRASSACGSPRRCRS